MPPSSLFWSLTNDPELRFRQGGGLFFLTPLTSALPSPSRFNHCETVIAISPPVPGFFLLRAPLIQMEAGYIASFPGLTP